MAPRALHEEAGLSLARSIKPLDAQGQPAPDGKIVLLSVGMSNTTQEFFTFQRMGDADTARNPRLVIVDGVPGCHGRKCDREARITAGQKFWDTVATAARKRRVPPAAQVQVASMSRPMPGHRGPNSNTP